jgi:hypothetical protein
MAPTRSRLSSGRLFLSVVLLSFFSSVVSALSTKSTLLIIAREMDAARSAHSGLQGYGIPYRVLVIPQQGATLPQLNSSSTVGNFGGFVILGDVSYEYSKGSFRSGLTDPQWEQMFAYQRAFKVRMVRLDVYPCPKFGKLMEDDI